MTKKQFKEIADMLKEHRRVVNKEYSHRREDTLGINEIERDAKLMEINRIEISLIGICKRNDNQFDSERFREAANV